MPEIIDWAVVWMSVVVFLPTAFALVLLLFPKGREEAMRWWALLGTAATLGVSLGLFFQFKNDVIDFRGVNTNKVDERKVRAEASLEGRAAELDAAAAAEKPSRWKTWLARYPWIERFHIDYFLGADGIRMALVLLTTGLSFLAMIASWNINRYVRGYCILFLILETGMIGTFLSLDFFLFYIFWEVMLLPMYFLIGVWGGPRREYAAIKFFLYTLFGSVLILIAMLGLYFSNVNGISTFVTQNSVRDPDTGRSHLRVVADARGYLAHATEGKNLPVQNSFDFFVLQKTGKMAQAVLDL